MEPTREPGLAIHRLMHPIRVPFSPPMEKFWLPDAARIAAAAREVFA